MKQRQKQNNYLLIVVRWGWKWNNTNKLGWRIKGNNGNKIREPEQGP